MKNRGSAPGKDNEKDIKIEEIVEIKAHDQLSQLMYICCRDELLATAAYTPLPSPACCPAALVLLPPPAAAAAAAVLAASASCRRARTLACTGSIKRPTGQEEGGRHLRWAAAVVSACQHMRARTLHDPALPSPAAASLPAVSRAPPTSSWKSWSSATLMALMASARRNKYLRGRGQGRRQWGVVGGWASEGRMAARAVQPEKEAEASA